MVVGVLDLDGGVVHSAGDVEPGVVSAEPAGLVVGVRGGVHIRSSGVSGLPLCAPRVITGVLGSISGIRPSVGMFELLTMPSRLAYQPPRARLAIVGSVSATNDVASRFEPRARVDQITGVGGDCGVVCASAAGSPRGVDGASSSERVGNNILASWGSTPTGG